MNVRMSIVALVLVLPALWAVHASLPSLRATGADNPAKTTAVPVDITMHDFMEGVFQGPYRRLKAAIANEPKDNAGWKAVRSESLILAEGGNLLLLRKPEKDADKWAEFSTASRDAGAELFKAAKKKDFTASKKAYETMLTHCNACHKQFDNGKNQLEP
jgi:hypothetical protein